MQRKENSLSYMKGYLRYAAEFEKYVYIWTKAMADANAKMQQIYNVRAQSDGDLIVNVLEEYMLSDKQEEIHNALRSAKNSLMQIYSENVLPQKYRTFNAVVTMYEYLETGRCNTIQGHGGIYDTYEVERIQLAQLQQMVQMNKKLNSIEDSQRYICRELHAANRTLSNISLSLNEIEKTNAQIAENTAISATANQQTAAATQYMAWRTWIDG